MSASWRVIDLVVIHLVSSDEAPDSDDEENAADPVAVSEPVCEFRETRKPVEEVDATDDASDDPGTDEGNDEEDSEAVVEGSSDCEDQAVHRDRDESDEEADYGNDDEHEDPRPEVSGVPELIVPGYTGVADEETRHLEGGDQSKNGVDKEKDDCHSFTIMRGSN